MTRDVPMPHPGVVLREEFLEPMGLSVYALAKAIHVTRSRINEVCHGRQGITANIALRLGRFFEVDPQWFMNMQSKYDLRVQANSRRSSRERRRRAQGFVAGLPAKATSCSLVETPRSLPRRANRPPTKAPPA